MDEITKILPTKMNPHTKTDKGGKTMKTFIPFFIGAIIISGFYSCTSSRQTASNYGDDIYYSSKDAPARNPAAPATIPDRGASTPDVKSEKGQDQPEYDYYDENIVAEDGSVTNNYYGDYNNYSSDDYYDYAYSSRIRRFHNPVGFGYYDPFYTNMYYYNYDPYFWGTSIYTSYNFWSPSPWSWGYSMGWNSGWGTYGVGWGGYYGWGHYSGWGYPGWGGYNRGYAHGYNHGYWNGYNNGLANDYYYNSFDKNSHHYGPRNSGTGGGSAARSMHSQRSLGQVYQSAMVNEKKSNKTDVPRGNITGVSAAKPAARSATSASQEKGAISTKPASSASGSKAARSTVTPQRSNANAQQPAQRSAASPARSGNASTSGAVNAENNNVRSAQTKPSVKPERTPQGSGNNYNAPKRASENRYNVYNSPKRNPSTYQPQAPPNMNTNREMPNYNRQRTQSQRQAPTYNRNGSSSPSYNRGSSPSYSQPSRNYTPSNARPSRRSGSQPSRSGNSGYSQPAPSRSPVYSKPAPSRSPVYSQPAPSRSGGSMRAPSRSSGASGSPSNSRGSSPAGRSPR